MGDEQTTGKKAGEGKAQKPLSDDEVADLRAKLAAASARKVPPYVPPLSPDRQSRIKDVDELCDSGEGQAEVDAAIAGHEVCKDPGVTASQVPLREGRRVSLNKNDGWVSVTQRPPHRLEQASSSPDDSRGR